MTLVAIVLLAAPVQLAQEPARPPESRPVEARLEPRSPDPKSPTGSGLRWSPKGATVVLSRRDAALEGNFALGPEGTLPVAVRLERSQDATHFDLLSIDLDRDGKLGERERLTTVPKDQRGKWWSSFEAELAIPLPPPPDGAPGAEPGTRPGTRPYPISAWFVEDPQEPGATPALRWSRRGWHEGQVELGGKPAFVLITEMRMDGVFDQRDAWALARDRESLLGATSRSLDNHVWLDGAAWRLVRVDPHGRSVVFEQFDPGVTEEQERARSDPYAADKIAPRAERPLAFGQDLAAAMDAAQKDGKRVFIDFETTWCGPCKTMTELVYTAAAVVEAASDVIAVKVDGDEHRDLVKRHAVTGYPTMILLDPDGKELRRASGYRGVAELVRFLKR